MKTTMMKILETCFSVYSEAITTRGGSVKQQDKNYCCTFHICDVKKVEFISPPFGQGCSLDGY